MNANQFTVGAKLFCDFHFGGKPKATCLEIVKPGNGKDSAGTVRVKLTETVGAYRKGEILEVSTYYAVPCKMILPRKSGEFFTRISTLYSWVTPDCMSCKLGDKGKVHSLKSCPGQ